VLGVDVARYGADRTAIAVRRGRTVMVSDAKGGWDTMQTAAAVNGAMEQFGAVLAQIDGVGVGAGVVDRVRELGKNVIDMQSSMAPSPWTVDAQTGSSVFLNARAEWWWQVRLAFEAGEIAIPPDDAELAEQLLSLQYQFTSTAKLKIMSKDDMHSRGLRSPDRADALMFAWATVYETPALPSSVVGLG